MAEDQRQTLGRIKTMTGRLKKIQYRPRLIDGRLAAAGLKIEPW